MIVIVGAGPIGCYLGEILAKAGKEVSIFEEHNSIGKPIQCTGIITKDIEKLVKLEKGIIVNRIDKVKIFSRNRKAEVIIDDIVINREKFDRSLAKRAKKEGAKIFLNHKFIGIKEKYAVFSDKKNKIKKFEAEYIIGADGPMSDVAKSNKMMGKRKFFLGMQARVKGKWEKGCYETYFGSIAPGFFAWIVPESDKIARVGIASRGKAREGFRRFMEIKEIEDKQIIDLQAGMIPVYDRNICVQKGNVILVGDAAGHVKATTGGGLIPGMRAAQKLAKSIIKGRSYKKELRKLNRGLNMHLMVRKLLDKMSDKDYNALINDIGSKKVRKILKENTRDNPEKLIFKTIIAKPSLLKLTTKFIKNVLFS